MLELNYNKDIIVTVIADFEIVFHRIVLQCIFKFRLDLIYVLGDIRANSTLSL